jgi:hypothetical protein
MNLIGLLTAALAVAVGCSTGFPDLRPTIQADAKNAENAQKVEAAPTGFKLIRMANGIKDDGAPFSTNVYETTRDKQKVWQDFFHYDSPEEVKTAFDVQVKKATKILETGNLLDSQGQTIGERAVLVFNPPDKKSSVMILVTDGNRLRDIQSYSLDDAMEFEKQSHPGPREKKPDR